MVLFHVGSFFFVLSISVSYTTALSLPALRNHGFSRTPVKTGISQGPLTVAVDAVIRNKTLPTTAQTTHGLFELKPSNSLSFNSTTVAGRSKLDNAAERGHQFSNTTDLGIDNLQSNSSIPENGHKSAYTFSWAFTDDFERFNDVISSIGLACFIMLLAFISGYLAYKLWSWYKRYIFNHYWQGANDMNVHTTYYGKNDQTEVTSPNSQSNHIVEARDVSLHEVTVSVTHGRSNSQSMQCSLLGCKSEDNKDHLATIHEQQNIQVNATANDINGNDERICTAVNAETLTYINADELNATIIVDATVPADEVNVSIGDNGSTTNADECYKDTSKYQKHPAIDKFVDVVAMGDVTVDAQNGQEDNME